MKAVFKTIQNTQPYLEGLPYYKGKHLVETDLTIRCFKTHRDYQKVYWLLDFRAQDLNVTVLLSFYLEKLDSYISL